MIQTLYVLMAASGLMVAGYGANEMTHGGFAEGMGLGHHHMADYGGYHCADQGDADWDQHVQHMHDAGAADFADHCGGDHMGAGHHGGMMP